VCSDVGSFQEYFQKGIVERVPANFVVAREVATSTHQFCTTQNGAGTQPSSGRINSIGNHEGSFNEDSVGVAKEGRRNVIIAVRW